MPPNFQSGSDLPYPVAASVERMSAISDKTDVLRSLGRLVRGLSALFWGLPLTLISYVQTAQTDWLQVLGLYGAATPLIATGVLFYGLWQIGTFQPRERIWISAVEVTKFIAVVNLGLAPFLYWWHKLPGIPLYATSVAALFFSSIFFLYFLNIVLLRLSAMLPDETLRLEVKMFSMMNRAVLLSIPVLSALYLVLGRLKSLPRFVIEILARVHVVDLWLILFLMLVPLAMTMALIWKTKEVVFTSVFEAEH
jgi:hypothetical protein